MQWNAGERYGNTGSEREAQMPGVRLTEQDRRDIADGLRQGLGYAEIARRLNRPTSTISREVRRNGGFGRYRPGPAQQATVRRARRRRPHAGGAEGPDTADHAALRTIIERMTVLFGATGMPRTAAGVLACLYTTDSGSLVAAELAALLRVSPAAISAAVGYLESQELITRHRDDPHRRDRYTIDEDVWLRATLAGARQNNALAAEARDSAAALGISSDAGKRLTEMSDFLTHVGRAMVRSTEQWRELRKASE